MSELGLELDLGNKQTNDQIRVRIRARAVVVKVRVWVTSQGYYLRLGLGTHLLLLVRLSHSRRSMPEESR